MDIVISNASGVPLYERIEEQLKSRILSGGLSEGDVLPSMRVPAKELLGMLIVRQRKDLPWKILQM